MRHPVFRVASERTCLADRNPHVKRGAVWSHPDAGRADRGATGPSALTRRVCLQLAAAAALESLYGAAKAAEPSRVVAVAYPELAEPFRQVFTSIVEGVQERLRATVQTYVVTPATSAAELAEDMKRRELKALIGLGRGGMRMAAALANDLPVLVGCVVSVPEVEARNFPVHSLAPDPVLLLGRLRRLVPAVKRVHVVVDPRVNGWLARLAREGLRADGVELLVQEATDPSVALRLYSQLMAATEPGRDAVWLPQDPTTVDDNVVLSLVLREAWNRGIPVVSSQVAHVKRGALISMYPDNFEIGRSLATAALKLQSNPKALPPGLLPMRETRSAINVRTAAHLGIELGAAAGTFDMVFPAS